MSGVDLNDVPRRLSWPDRWWCWACAAYSTVLALVFTLAGIAVGQWCSLAALVLCLYAATRSPKTSVRSLRTQGSAATGRDQTK